MNEFDQFVKHRLRVKNYARYTDDFMIVSEDRRYLEDLLPQLQDFLREKLKLELHPNKISIHKFHEGIDFLGYVIFPYYRLLRSKTKRRVLRNIRKKMRAYQNALLSEESLHQSLQSYLGVLSHADAYELTENLKNQVWYWTKE
ncbi:hypothetical protein A3C32_02725 [Candidatus Daviesbacteria bacterium RIFCSPHIGHO2_02_FULL_41_14]|nr:MAG: hypothetical protein A3C32_02725 [Candidatus Daviesbacteria bacterium RIFCSPHIGHO2_02_FULL_41_14]